MEEKKIQITKDQAFTVVCSIRTPTINGQEIVGTGVFISTDSNVYLVTASHVAKDTNFKSYIILCDKDNNPLSRPLIQLNSQLNWINHPTEDISALEISIKANVDILNHRCFPANQIEEKPNSISRDDELTCIGFPNGLGVVGKFSPFTFRSYASSSEITLNRFDTGTPAEFFCLENPSVGGYSGGPVFDLGVMFVGVMKSSKGPTRLLGLMHGTICDNTGGKIAAVTPACFILDLIK